MVFFIKGRTKSKCTGVRTMFVTCLSRGKCWGGIVTTLKEFHDCIVFNTISVNTIYVGMTLVCCNLSEKSCYS